MAKKIINPGADYVEEAIQGFLLSNWRHYERGEDPEEKIIIYKQRKRDTVALLIGGGSGHEPIYTVWAMHPAQAISSHLRTRS